MIKGIIEQRTAPRIPIAKQIVIRFIKSNEKYIIGESVDISAGGLKFTIPWGEDIFHSGDQIEIVFKDVPFLGEISLTAEVRHEQPGIDHDLNRIILYGARFINLSMESWGYILDYCHTIIASQVGPEINQNKENIQRKDIRIIAKYKVEVKVENQTYQAFVENISFGGAGIKLSEELQPDQSVTLLFSSLGIQFGIQGTCVWNKSDNGQTHAGISFDKLTSEELFNLRGIMYNSMNIS
jgi:hypothetical protein